jgi:hypothetical protein
MDDEEVRSQNPGVSQGFAFGSIRLQKGEAQRPHFPF